MTTIATTLSRRLVTTVSVARPFSSAAATAYANDATAAGPARTHANWLEHQCGDVPVTLREHDDAISEMVRGGHALQVANKALLHAKLTSSRRGGATAYDEAHTTTLESLFALEQTAVERIERAGTRFRPSVLLPLVQCSSTAVGAALSLFSEHTSTSYETGLKVAISDYYNDQIRELYATKPHEQALKDLFKTARDEELAFVEAHASPEVLDDANVATTDAVATFAKATSKVLLQVTKVV